MKKFRFPFFSKHQPIVATTKQIIDAKSGKPLDEISGSGGNDSSSDSVESLMSYIDFISIVCDHIAPIDETLYGFVLTGTADSFFVSLPDNRQIKVNIKRYITEHYYDTSAFLTWEDDLFKYESIVAFYSELSYSNECSIHVKDIPWVYNIYDTGVFEVIRKGFINTYSILNILTEANTHNNINPKIIDAFEGVVLTGNYGAEIYSNGITLNNDNYHLELRELENIYDGSDYKTTVCIVLVKE